MTKEEFEIKAIEYLSGTMNEEDSASFMQSLTAHPEFKNVFEGLHETWNEIDRLPVPEPSTEMDSKFYEVLNSYEHKEGKIKTFGDRLQALFEALWRPQLAYGLLLLAIGLGAGYYLNSDSTDIPPQTVVRTDSETEEVREKLVLTLLEQPSANKRLQGINEANKIRKVDETVMKALLQTLNNDPNVNVRLAAIESLTNYLDSPMVREGLVQSIVSQESPIVQVTLANLMVALQEKKSIEPFKKLIRSKELDTSVKKKLESSIKEII